MTCSVCGAPAHYAYAEGSEVAAFCAICDRIGAEDEPAGRVYLTGPIVAALFIAILLLLPAVTL